MSTIPSKYERAEFISDEEILRQPVFNKSAVDTIKTYARWNLFAPKKNRRIVLGIVAMLDSEVKEKYKLYNSLLKGERSQEYSKLSDMFNYPTVIDMYNKKHSISEITKYVHENAASHNHKKTQDECEICINKVNEIFQEWGSAKSKLRKELYGKAKSFMENYNEEIKPVDYPLFVLGRKGLGKTFIAKRVKAELSNEGVHTAFLKFVDDEFVDVDTSNSVDLNNLKGFDTIILDDIHYWLERSLENPTTLNQNLQLVKKLYKLPKEERVMSVFISEFPLRYYEPYLNNQEYTEIVDNMERSSESALIQREIEAPSLEDMKKMVEHYGIPYDDTSVKILHTIKPNHRSILRIARLLGDLRYEALVKKAELIMERKLSHTNLEICKKVLSIANPKPSDSEFFAFSDAGYYPNEWYREVVVRSRLKGSGWKIEKEHVLTKPFEYAFYDIMNYGLESPVIKSTLDTINEKEVKHRNRRNYTDQEDEFIKENYIKMTDKEIASALGRQSVSIHFHRLLLGLRKL